MAEPGDPDQIWGPREGFVFGALAADAAREGGAVAWVSRALTSYYFIVHDNRPSTEAEIQAWADELPPALIQVAIEVAIAVGLP